MIQTLKKYWKWYLVSGLSFVAGVFVGITLAVYVLINAFH